jgi:hypothetical protein
MRLGQLFITAVQLSATTCHEMAHQIGFASESECNFIGFLASVKNDDLYFKYSGLVLLTLAIQLANKRRSRFKIIKNCSSLF